VNWYRHSELEGSILLGRFIRQATDPYLVRELTRHAAEEARHAWVWTRAIDAAGLPTVRIYRSYQSFYRDELAPPRSLLEVLALTHVFEQRVERRFTDELSRPGVPEPIRRAFSQMLRDEQHHLHWIGQWLARQSDAGIVLDRYRAADERVARRLTPFSERLWDVSGLGEEFGSDVGVEAVAAV
jgi:tRNA isopentenyl-2-thiomethyl-A-37 hydroxylase MiaE